MPSTSQDKMKICRDGSFTHMALHEPTGTTFSMPPKDLSKNTWGQDVPQGLKDECRNVLVSNHGDGADEVFKFNSYRMCWSVIRTLVVPWQYLHTSRTVAAIADFSISLTQGRCHAGYRVHHQPAPQESEPVHCNRRLVPRMEVPVRAQNFLPAPKTY